jgi:hypothetical protein
VVEVLEISQAEQESRKSAARGTLNFSELRYGEVRRSLRASKNIQDRLDNTVLASIFMKLCSKEPTSGAPTS